MATEINIREVEESDFIQIIDLFKELAAFEKSPNKMLNSVEQMKEETAFFNCFIAETKDHKIIGYATYFTAYYTWIGKSLYMDDLYVKPDHRGNGIGTQLIKKVIEFAKNSKCHKLRWQVSGWNERAIKFYQTLGADVDATEQNCDLIFK